MLQPVEPGVDVRKDVQYTVHRRNCIPLHKQARALNDLKKEQRVEEVVKSSIY